MTPQAVSLPARLQGHAVSPGRPWPMGASQTGDGVNFAVFSAHAERIELCLFTPDGRKELCRLPITDRDGDICIVAQLLGASWGRSPRNPSVEARKA